MNVQEMMKQDVNSVIGLNVSYDFGGTKQFGSVGYNLDLSNGELSRVCLCYAHSENECMCGAWSLDEK
jgi:hypothetical protein